MKRAKAGAGNAEPLPLLETPLELRSFYNHGASAPSTWRLGPGGAWKAAEGRPHSWSIWRAAAAAFLPTNFPDSVTSDYLPFQVFDTLQGVCSYVRGMLVTHALMTGVGVGDATATALGATTVWFARDFTAMLGGIFFAVASGTSLDGGAKQWRLFADLMNNVGMALELAAPSIPRFFLPLAIAGALARTLTGVAAGATRAALTQHFAVRGNAADVAAKEGSQETAATLIGLVLGMATLRHVAAAPWLPWAVFAVLTAMHIGLNVAAVRCLTLATLNPERTRLLLTAFVADDAVAAVPASPRGRRRHLPRMSRVPPPADLPPREMLLPPALPYGLSRRMMALWRGWGARGEPPNPCPERLVVLGAGLESPSARAMLAAHARGAAPAAYLVGRSPSGLSLVWLRRGACPESLLRAFSHGLYLAMLPAGGDPQAAEAQAEAWATDRGPAFLAAIAAAGWVTAHPALAPREWRVEW